MPTDIKPIWTEAGSESNTDTSNMNMTQDFQLTGYCNPTAYAQQAYNLYNPSSYYQFRNGLYLNTPTLYGNTYQTGFDYNNYAATYGIPYLNAAASNSKSSPISSIQQHYRNSIMGTNGYSTMSASPGSTSTQSYPGINGVGAVKLDKPKSRKRKKNQQLADSGQQFKRVFVWELDDICDLRAVTPSWKAQIAQLVEQMLKNFFDISSYDDYDHINIDDGPVDEVFSESTFTGGSDESFSSTAEDKSGAADPAAPNASSAPAAAVPSGPAIDSLKKMAQKQQLIKSVYRQYQENAPGILGEDAKRMFDILDTMNMLEVQKLYKKCLKLAVDRSGPSVQFANAVLARESLPAALARLLLNGAAPAVPVEHVYSAVRNDRAAALEKLTQRFRKESIVLVTSSPETQQIARAHNIPVWQVYSPQDVDKFYIAMDRVLC